MKWVERLRCRFTRHSFGEGRKSDGHLASWVSGYDVFIFTCQTCGHQVGVEQHWQATERGSIPSTRDAEARGAAL